MNADLVSLSDLVVIRIDDLNILIQRVLRILYALQLPPAHFLPLWLVQLPPLILLPVVVVLSHNIFDILSRLFPCYFNAVGVSFADSLQLVVLVDAKQRILALAAIPPLNLGAAFVALLD